MPFESDQDRAILSELLSSIRRRIREGEFDETLLVDAERLVARLPEFGSHDQLLRLKALNSAAEVNDYFGRYAVAKGILENDAVDVFTNFKHWVSPLSREVRPFLKEKTILLMNFGLSQYRANQGKQALKTLDQARELLVRLIKTDKDPCHSSFSVLEYFCGQIHRQVLDYQRASVAFAASIDHAEKRVRWCRDHPESGREDRLAQEEQRARRRTALALALGLGWMAARQGALQQALPLFLTARGLLFGTNDWVGKAYVELLLGTVQRAMAGFEKVRLEEAVETLRVPYGIFSPTGDNGQGVGHLPYQAHAAYQLALATLYAERFVECESHVKEVKRIAQVIGSSRWRCNGLVVESRLMRKLGRAPEAASAAATALDLARESDDGLTEIDSLIACGEASLLLGDAEAAREELRSALAKVRDNVQTEAVCNIHLAGVCLQLRDVKAAKAHMDAWMRLKPRIESQVAIFLAARAEKEFKAALLDFVISRAETNLKWEHWERALWNFLNKVATERNPGNVQEVFYLVDLKKPTYYRMKSRMAQGKKALHPHSGECETQSLEVGRS